MVLVQSFLNTFDIIYIPFASIAEIYFLIWISVCCGSVTQRLRKLSCAVLQSPRFLQPSPDQLYTYTCFFVTNDGKLYESLRRAARPKTGCSGCHRNAAAAATNDREEGGLFAEED